jgi:hypothetical protein
MYVDKPAPFLLAFAGKGELWPCDPAGAIFEFRAVVLTLPCLGEKTLLIFCRHVADQR